MRDKDDWRSRHETKKAEVGMASYGTVEYWRNAAKVLATHAGPGMRPETRWKLKSLAESDDPITRIIAKNALLGSNMEEESIEENEE